MTTNKDKEELVIPESEDPVDAVEFADASDTPIACENITREDKRKMKNGEEG